jgi:hypothetical protein
MERATLPCPYCKCGQQMTLRFVDTDDPYMLNAIWRCQGCGQEGPAWFKSEPRPPMWNINIKNFG